jgi:hypothetical protein
MKKLIFIYITLILFVINLKAQETEYCGTEQRLRDQQCLKKTYDHPTLSGNPQSIITTHFKIHYTLSGADSTTISWAESTAVYAEHCWRFCDSLGWIMPPPDGTTGGDSLYDIYIGNPKGGWGLTSSGVPYTNPYIDGMTSWIEIYRDSIPRPLIKYTGLRSLIAHEFSHAIQLRYSSVEYTFDQYGGDVRWQHWWINENTAVYMEDVIFDDINSLQAFRFDEGLDPLDSPNLPICYGKDLYQYTGALWPTFLHECYNNSIVIKIWEMFGSVSGPNVYSGIDSALKVYTNSNLSKALREYAVWRSFTGSFNDNLHFSEASSYPDCAIHWNQNAGSSWVDALNPLPSGPGGMSFDIINDDYNIVNIYFDGANNYKWATTAIWITDNSFYSEKVEKIFTLDSLNAGLVKLARPDSSDAAIFLISVVTDTSYGADSLNYRFKVEECEGSVVYFYNKIHGSDVGGNLLLSIIDTVSSGDYRVLTTGQLDTVKTLHERFETDSTYKHHDWESVSSSKKLVNIFYVDDNLNKIANFNGIRPVVIRNELLESPGSNFGTIQFRDSWYLHSNGTQPDSFFSYSYYHIPTGAYNKTTGGVFLNQPYDPAHPENPYYSVRAPLTQVINTRNFLWWSASNADFVNTGDSLANYNTRAVIFHSPNDTIRAYYKVKQSSSTTTATEGNNQRKLVYNKSYGGVSVPMYAAYESADRVWFTYSSNSGTTWIPEQTLGYGKYVSLSQAPDSSYYVDAVWQSDSSTSKVVKYSKWSPSGSLYTRTLESGLSCSSSDLKPVIARTNGSTSLGSILSVWSNGSLLRYSYCDASSPNTWYGPSNVTNELGGRFNPSLSYCVSSNGTYNSFLTSDNNVDCIWLRGVKKSGSSLLWSDPRDVPGDGNVEENYNAQVQAETCGTYGKAHIVWEGIDYGAHKFIFYQALTQTVDFEQNNNELSNTFSPLFEITGLDFSLPSIGVFNGGDVAITWQDYDEFTEEHYLFRNNYFINDDSVECFASQAYNGNIISGDQRLTLSNSKMTFTGNYTSLHNINFNSAKVSASSGNLKVMESSTGIKKLVVTPSNGVLIADANLQSSITLMINSLQVENQDGTIDTIEPADIYPNTVICNVGIDKLIEKLSGKEITLSSKAKSLKIKYSIRGKNIKNLLEDADVPIKLSVSMQDNDNNSNNKSVSLVDLNSDSVNIKEAEVSIPISSHYAGKKFAVKPSLSGLLQSIGTDKKYYTNAIRRYDIRFLTEEEMVKQNSSVENGIPSEYSLNQNYPNPFNPTTVINYQLPTNGFMSLKVYDVLGKEVATLVNEYKEAGYYEASFDASRLSSGVYFYKLQAGNFVMTKKMLLAK